MTRLSVIPRLVALILAASLIVWHPASMGAQAPDLSAVANDLVSVQDLPEDRVLEFVIGPAHLHVGGPHLRLPIQMAAFPFDGWLHGFEWEMRDAQGQKLPDDLLHHVNFIDPDNRELFSSTARRVLAAGRETGKQEMPHLLGYPVEEGSRVLVSAMLASPTDQDYEDVYLHVRLFYSLKGEGIMEPRDVYLFYIDVMGPVGEKDFALPPGRTVRTWEGRPAVDGRILAIGGHLHDYAEEIRLEDATTGKVVWRSEPNVDDTGRVTGVPTGHLWWRGGAKISKDHVYRLVVEYDNPSGHMAPAGGMGAAGGLFMPAGDSRFPELDRTDNDYLVDLTNTLEAPEKAKGHGHGHGAGGGL